MNDTPTPRTDKAWNTFAASHVQRARNMRDKAKKLERELADMTKQRDHYKAACDQYSEDEMLCKLQEVTKQRDSLAFSIRFALANSLADSKSETILRQALAAMKGGSDE